jgi:CheY-like chemotaxis protein
MMPHVILLVEDHHDTRQMYAEFMAPRYEVLEAATAAEAVRQMLVRRPDLLVTDLSLPDVDGFELVTRMRAQPALADVPVICLSGYGGHAHEERAREVGCDRLLQKPCLPDTLADIVADVLGTSGRRSPNA